MSSPPRRRTTRSQLHGRRLVEPIAFLIAVLAPCLVCAAPVTVLVQGTLFNADGTKPSGTLTVLSRPFTAADGAAVIGASKVYPFAAGVVSISLIPNAGSTPAGSCYEVTIRSTDTGVTLNETWVVPASGPATLAQVRDPTKTIPCPSVQ